MAQSFAAVWFRSPWPILYAALAIRLIVIACAWAGSGGWQSVHAPDTARYLRAAESLWSTGRFAVDGKPEILRTPGYPLMLVPGVAAGHVEAVTIGLQLIVGLVGLFLIYKTGLLLTDRADYAAAGAWLYALEPLSVLFTARLLSETLFGSLMIGAMYLLARYVRQGRARTLLCAAVVLVAAAYVRPIAYYLPIAVTLALLIRAGWFAVPSRRRAAGGAAAFAATCVLLLGSWQVRNGTATGYRGFSAISERNVYFEHAAAVLAVEQGTTLSEQRRKLGYRDLECYLAAHPEQRSWSDAQRLGFMKRAGVQTILRAPATYGLIHLEGMGRTLLAPGATQWLALLGVAPAERISLAELAHGRTIPASLADFARREPLALAANLACAGVLVAYLALGAVALLRWRRTRGDALVIVVGIAAYFLLLSGGPIGEHRFRHPIMASVCLLGGCSLCWMIETLRARGRGRDQSARRPRLPIPPQARRQSKSFPGPSRSVSS